MSTQRAVALAVQRNQALDEVRRLRALLKKRDEYTFEVLEAEARDSGRGQEAILFAIERLRAAYAIDFDANAHADAVHDKIKALGNPHRPIDAKGTT